MSCSVNKYLFRNICNEQWSWVSYPVLTWKYLFKAMVIAQVKKTLWNHFRLREDPYLLDINDVVKRWKRNKRTFALEFVKQIYIYNIYNIYNITNILSYNRMVLFVETLFCLYYVITLRWALLTFIRCSVIKNHNEKYIFKTILKYFAVNNHF